MHLEGGLCTPVGEPCAPGGGLCTWREGPLAPGGGPPCTCGGPCTPGGPLYTWTRALCICRGALCTRRGALCTWRGALCTWGSPVYLGEGPLAPGGGTQQSSTSQLHCGVHRTSHPRQGSVHAQTMSVSIFSGSCYCPLCCSHINPKPHNTVLYLCFKLSAAVSVS